MRTFIRAGLCAAIAVVALATPMLGASSAQASSGAAWWKLNSSVLPTNLPPGGEGTVTLTAINLGDQATSGEVKISDVLPPGLKVVEVEGPGGKPAPDVEFRAFGLSEGKFDLGPTTFVGSNNHFCEVVGGRVSCRYVEGPEVEEPYRPALGPIAPYEDIELRIHVKNEGAASGAQIVGEVSGRGTPAASAVKALNASPTPAGFGVENYQLVPEEPGGGVDSQAGSHPFQLTTTFALNQTADEAKPPALPRNLQFKWPPGLIGNAAAIPRCSDVQFRTRIPGGTANECPASTAVGVATLVIDEPDSLGLATLPVPLFNLEPTKGEPARFGFEFAGSPVTIDTSVRTGGDYGVTVSVSNVTELTNFIDTTVTVWGVPDDPSHDAARGWNCLAGGYGNTPIKPCTPPGGSQAAPFLTLPTSCAAPFTSTVSGESWPKRSEPGAELATIPLPEATYTLEDSFGRTVGMTGCNDEPFQPAVEVAPDGQAASTPTGLAVHVRVPQEVSENPLGVSSSNVKDIAIAFPEGMTVNPAAANGLEACPESLVGFQGFRELASLPGIGSAIFSPELAEPLQPGVSTCQDASKIGTVKIISPLLPAGQFVEGSLYLGTPAPNGEGGKNPFNSLISEYILAKDPVSGVVVKLPGEVSLNPVTGQITATFKNNPQLAFEDAEVHLFGGSRAPFSTPAHCGSYTTDATFTPWSGGPPATSTSTFQVLSGPNGGPCPGAALPFAPSLAGGMTNINAGAFSPLTTTIGREDGQQNIQAVKLHMPAGLSGILSGVALCPEAQANAGTCSQASLIGKTIVSVGLGNEPFSVTGGQVFLTEKYEGAPFGLSIVNPAVAGPFNLGTVVVRAKIEVDPHSAALTVTTDETGPYAIPHILDGIPLQIKHVNVTIDGVGGNDKFTFNPTNCSPLQITGSIASAESASAPVGTPFQVTNCASLKFTPKFSVSASGKNSKEGGASLTAKLSEPAGAQGSQANITRVKVDLPKQLPSRLKTLQKACTNAQFELNPANCPKESRIGYAKVTTPLLPVPLEGPAIFVSHGNEAFPSLTMVLQGYGVTVDLVGTTFISKAGITSTTFKTVPDVPFNTFTLTLPQGKFSALAANVPNKDHYSLCGQTLAMPTEFLAQNGAKINESTPISVSGCAKAKALTRTEKLEKALKTCRKKGNKAKREQCEKTAQKNYGTKTKGKSKKKK